MRAHSIRIAVAFAVASSSLASACGGAEVGAEQPDGGSAANTGSGAGGPGGAGSGGACSSSPCNSGMASGLCVAGSCVPIESADCPAAYGATADTNAIVLGMMATNDALGTDEVNGVVLAIQEINDASGGIALCAQKSDPSCVPRPLEVVACDTTSTAAHALIDTLHVPAIIGPDATADVLGVTATVAVPSDVAIVSPLADGPALASFTDNGLVWSVAPNRLGEVHALDALTAETEIAVRTGLGIPATQPISVALMSPNDGDDADVAAQVAATLVYNGKSADENAAAGTFEWVKYAVADLAPAIADVGAYLPQIVIVVGSDEAAQIIEGIWSLKVGPGQQFIVPGSAQTQSLLTTTSDNSDLTSRIHGTTLLWGSAATPAFSARYVANYSGASASRAAGNAYDAAYAVAYSVAYADQLTGSAIAQRIPLLVSSAAPLQVGPEDVVQALTSMGTGASINLEGASGELDFDALTGAPYADYGFSCIGSDGAFDATGQVFHSASGSVSGTSVCP